MILLDTSFLISLLKNDKKAITILKKIQNQKLYISTISLAELQVGFLRRSKGNREISKIIGSLTEGDSVVLISVDTSIMLQYAKIQAELLEEGNQLGQFDALIAATAIAHKLKLLTFDSDFRRVKGLKLYPY